MYKNGKYRETDKMSDLICLYFPDSRQFPDGRDYRSRHQRKQLPLH